MIFLSHCFASLAGSPITRNSAFPAPLREINERSGPRRTAEFAQQTKIGAVCSTELSERNTKKQTLLCVLGELSGYPLTEKALVSASTAMRQSPRIRRFFETDSTSCGRRHRWLVVVS